MNHAWIEDTVIESQEVFEHVIGDEIFHLIGEEIFDVGPIPFDPPQYYTEDTPYDPPEYYTENISQDPPQYHDVVVGTGDGVVKGINRVGIYPEQTGTNTPQELVNGMDSQFYKIVSRVFTPLDSTEMQVIIDARQVIMDADTQRTEEIDAEQEAEGTSDYTIQELDDYLAEKYDPTVYDQLGQVIYNLPDTDISPAARDALVDMFVEIKKVFNVSRVVDRKMGIETLK